MANELWKPVKGFEGVYEVSSEGHVRSVDRIDARGQLRKSKMLNINKKQQVSFFRDGKRKKYLVRKLVVDAFLEKPKADEKLVHVDGNLDNNCVSNLKWQKRAKRKRNVYRFEDNKTGEALEPQSRSL